MGGGTDTPPAGIRRLPDVLAAAMCKRTARGAERLPGISGPRRHASPPAGLRRRPAGTSVSVAAMVSVAVIVSAGISRRAKGHPS